MEVSTEVEVSTEAEAVTGNSDHLLQTRMMRQEKAHAHKQYDARNK